MIKFVPKASSGKRRLSVISTALLASACALSFQAAALNPQSTDSANLSISHASLTGGGHTFELGQNNVNNLVDLSQPAFSLNLEVQSSNRNPSSIAELTFELDLPGIGAFPLLYSVQGQALKQGRGGKLANVTQAEKVVVLGKDLAVSGKVGQTYELFLTQAAYDALKYVGRDTMAQVVIRIDGKNTSERVLSDNQSKMSVVFLPNIKKMTNDKFSVAADSVKTASRAISPLSAGGYSRTWFNVGKSANYGNNSYFSGGYNVGAKMTYQTTSNNVPYAVNFDSPNDVNVHVFGSKHYFLQANAGLDFNADDISGSYFKYNVNVAGRRIWDGDYSFPRNASGNVVIWSKNYSKYKEYSKSKTFFIGPVPVNVEGGVKGTVGLGGELLLKPQNKVALAANVNGNLTGFAQAGVNGGVARAGAGANLTVIDMKQELIPSFQIQPSQSTAKFAINAPLSLSTLDGNVYIYADNRTVKICKRWGIPYPCGVEWNRIGDLTLINWNGYSYNYNLVNKEYVWR